MTLNQFVAKSSGIGENKIAATLDLLNDGATIPFIARYRKERTQGLDEVEIATIRDLNHVFREIEARKKFILETIEAQGKLEQMLQEKIEKCFELKDLEDLYLPFKPKRKSRADEARKKGLEPLAKQLMAQHGADPELLARRYLKGDLTEIEEALSGARDIIAEWLNEHIFLRRKLRNLFERKAILTSDLVKGKDQEAALYKDYFNHKELLRSCPSHRFLAIARGEREGFLKVKALPEKEEALALLFDIVLKNQGADAQQVAKAAKDAYSRLLSPSLETELLNDAKLKADDEAIQVFAKNLKNLLLAPPLGQRRILAIDPGFRTGCKVVCLNEQGELLHNENIFPHPPQNEKSKASSKLQQLVSAYKIDTLAIGDGTAGRETEDWVKHLRFERDVQVFVVREDGASIYSASAVARKEFPNFDVTVRGAVSIGRRLADPLSELVKIDPKSLGVGQYQHDVDQKKLKAALDDVVISAVNQVGVDVNTASPYLLQYVSGLTLANAEKLVEYRAEHGAFKNRLSLMHVPRMGAKTFEQAAGFLRIRDGENPLDNTAVHPESYTLVKQIATEQQTTISDLIGNEALIQRILDVSDESFTMRDVLLELKKPGRDPRKQIRALNFSQKIRTISDLQVGMKLPVVVTNVTNFGAFVNIGIKENGLIHKSHLHEGYVENPADFIALHDHVEVEVLSIDIERKRIGLKRLA
jgi:uncharacterized protein